MKRRILTIGAIILIAILTLSVTTTKNEIIQPLEEETMQVENWMLKSFFDFVEEPLVVEEWMTKPFKIN